MNGFYFLVLKIHEKTVFLQVNLISFILTP